MKAFIVGKHHDHVGCQAVSMVLEGIVETHCELVGHPKEADVVIVNGEGSMHHNTGNLNIKTKAIRAAKERGQKVMLVNSVWDSVSSKDMLALLPNIDYISVRELRSWTELNRKHGLNPDINIDLAYFYPVHMFYELTPNKEKILMGDFFPIYGGQINHKLKQHPSFIKHFSGRFKDYDIKRSKTWSEHLIGLHGAKCLITGRHHDAIACCKVRTPFVSLVGNTHKVDGIFELAGVNLRCATTFGELNDKLERLDEDLPEYEKLFDFMAQQKCWEFPKL